MRLSAPVRIAVAAGALALLWTALLAAPHLSGRRSILDPAEAWLLDLRTAAFGVRRPEAPVTVIAIDDATLASPAFGFPIRRDKLALLIDRAVGAGAAAIALDILLVDPGPADENAALAAALRKAPAVIAAAGEFGEGLAVAGVPETSSVFWPSAFEADAEVGFVNIVTDAAGTPQHLPLLFLTAGGIRPHLVLVAASLFAGEAPQIGASSVRLGGREIPLDIGFHLPVRLAGPSGTLPTVPAIDLIEGRARLDGRIAIIGVTASAVGDMFNTPFGRTVPGVEVLAGGIGQFFGGPTLSRTLEVRRIDAAASAAIAVGVGIATALLPLLWGVAAALGLVAAWLTVVTVAFAEGLWLSAALPLAAALPVAVGGAFARHLVERRRARRAARTAEALSRLQSPALAARIAADPTFLSEPVVRRAAVLFVDLAGFTTASERLGLEGTRALLKAFHGTVVRVVDAHGGLVLNFIGDGALAAFGLPDEGEDDADRALAAAFALVGPVRALAVDGLAPDLRIGLHLGRVLLARLGGEGHEQVTISGDVVNVAARLMEVAKEHGATVAVSEAVLSAAGRGPERAPDQRQTVAIRGREEALEVALWRLPR